MSQDNTSSTLYPGAILRGNNYVYKIESVLGHGTFGITYKATIQAGRRKGDTVTIKEFFVNGVSSRDESGIVYSDSRTVLIDQCKAEFVAEAKNLIILNHPNIVKAYEVFEANGTVYYSMEYINGENLNSYLKRVKVTPVEAVKIITKIAYGLSYMHESRHMLHLDLKPGNVMRRYSDGQIILIDFGLSRYFTDEDSPDTVKPIGMGTRGYAPLEQVVFNRRKKDFKATIDVYALGATYFKLVTGETPPDPLTLANNPGMLHDRLASVDMPEKSRRIIEKAMATKPDDRYQSVMAFIYDLNADERKRQKKGCLLSVVVLVGIIVAFFIGSKIVHLISTGKENAFNNCDDYAFEIVNDSHGANHYGEIEHYKFFSNGTCFYLFESWHDQLDCSDPDCNLTSRTDTMTIRYKVRNHRTVVFEMGQLSDYQSEAQVYIDLENKKIEIDKERNYDLSVDTVANWDEVRKIAERDR